MPANWKIPFLNGPHVSTCFTPNLNSSEDERGDGGAQAHASRQTARRHRRAVLGHADCVGEHLAADGVHAASVDLGRERLGVRLEIGPRLDIRRADLRQEGLGLGVVGLAAEGHHLVTHVREDCRGYGSNAPCGTC